MPRSPLITDINTDEAELVIVTYYNKHSDYFLKEQAPEVFASVVALPSDYLTEAVKQKLTELTQTTQITSLLKKNILLPTINRLLAAENLSKILENPLKIEARSKENIAEIKRASSGEIDFSKMDKSISERKDRYLTKPLKDKYKNYKYKTVQDYKAAKANKNPVDIRPEDFRANQKNIAGHGTNLTSVLSAIINSNSQLVPKIKAVKLGISQETGESGGLTTLNRKWVSTIELTGPYNDNYCMNYHWLDHYADFFSTSEFLKKTDILETDIIPCVAIGDGSTTNEGVKDGFRVRSDIKGELAYKRLNVRLLVIPEKFLEFASRAILEANSNSDIKVISKEKAADFIKKNDIEGLFNEAQNPLNLIKINPETNASINGNNASNDFISIKTPEGGGGATAVPNAIATKETNTKATTLNLSIELDSAKNSQPQEKSFFEVSIKKVEEIFQPKSQQLITQSLSNLQKTTNLTNPAETALVLLKPSQEDIKTTQFQVTTTPQNIAKKLKKSETLLLKNEPKNSDEVNKNKISSDSELIDKLIKNQIEETKNQINQKESSNQKLTNKQVGVIILIAIKNKGIGTQVGALKSSLSQLKEKNFINEEDEQSILKHAKEFSALFQKNMAESLIFTGNPCATSLVGMRTKRLHPKYAKFCLEKDLVTKNDDLYSKAFDILEIRKVLENPSEQPQENINPTTTNSLEAQNSR